MLLAPCQIAQWSRLAIAFMTSYSLYNQYHPSLDDRLEARVLVLRPGHDNALGYAVVVVVFLRCGGPMLSFEVVLVVVDVVVCVCGVAVAWF